MRVIELLAFGVVSVVYQLFFDILISASFVSTLPSPYLLALTFQTTGMKK